MKRLGALVMVGLVAVLKAGCSTGPADDGSHLLTAEEVGGTQADSGTQLLTPAVKDCAQVDGPKIWKDADDDDVRSFTRTVDDHTETTIIGAWPVPEDQASKAIGSISIDIDGSCTPRDVVVEPGHLAGLGPAYAYGRETKTAIEITHRDKKSDVDRRSVRAYAYTNSGYLVIVWASRPDKKPSQDRISDLLTAQGEKLGES